MQRKNAHKVLHIGASVLIHFIKALGYVGTISGAFFAYIILKPVAAFLRFFFYTIIIKIYSAYRLLMKRLGWDNFSEHFFSFMFYQRLVHVLVVIITVTILFINMTGKTSAGGLTDVASKTIISSLIESEFDNVEGADQLVVETFDREAVISPAQQSYLDNLEAVRPQPRVVMGDASEEDADVLTTPDGASLIRPETPETKITQRQREEIITHEVQPGDTISTIAQTYGISVSTILWENNLSVYSVIRPGDKLAILPMTGLMHTVKSGENLTQLSNKYNIDQDKIAVANNLDATQGLKIGQKIIIPDGQKISEAIFKPKTYSGIEAIKNIVKSPDAEPAIGNMMNWPTIGKRITQYYSWRHTGLDIANKIGTALYAADAGTVEFAGWGTGYGNQIVIDHGGGKKTRYAHASQLFVKKGDVVSKGQTIAAMGSTGWSTGSHLHFEVIINGKKYNPLNYIK